MSCVMGRDIQYSSKSPCKSSALQIVNQRGLWVQSVGSVEPQEAQALLTGWWDMEQDRLDYS